MTASSPLGAEDWPKPGVVPTVPDLMLAWPAMNLSRSRAMSSERRDIALAVLLESMCTLSRSNFRVSFDGSGVCRRMQRGQDKDKSLR